MRRLRALPLGWIAGRGLALCLGAAAIADPALALAHARLLKSEPAPDATVRKPPSKISLTFSEALSEPFCTLELQGAEGRPLALAARTVAGRTLEASTGPLSPGAYLVRWRVVSVDTHKTSGQFRFRVSPP